jgi:cullin 2
MQTFQMAILLLVEKTDSLTCKEVQESLQLNSEQFGKHLMSLIESKILLANVEVINMTLLSVCSSRSHEFVS